MIKRKDYNALIERVKVFARINPSMYRWRVFLLGILGYAYIFLVFSVLVVLIFGIAWAMLHARGGQAGLFKILIFLGILVWIILKSLWIKIEAPNGLPITEKDAPKLFAVIRDICVRQNSSQPDVVLLNSDLNAFISQVPRLGILGWYKNYLVLGLPYMIASDPGQFKAVLAHEFGHFSGSHGRIGTWIYRIRASWYNITTNLGNERTGNLLFKWFSDWYAPYFNAYSFVLAREHEYEADRYANAYAGAAANAEELINALIKSTAAGPYWQSVWSRVNDEPDPPQDVISKAVECLKVPLQEESYCDDLSRALKLRTQNHDTHPCLKERLAALGYSADGCRIVDAQGKQLVCQKDIPISAAEEYLGQQNIPEMLRYFDRQWAKQIEGQWRLRHAEVLEMKKELEGLEQKAQKGALDEADSVRQAYIIDQIFSPQEALLAIRALLQRYPDNAPAHYRLGQLFLEEYNDQGIEHLKKAMQLDNSFSSACLERLSRYHESKGEYQQVDSVLENLDQTAENDQKDYAERNNIANKDKFREHGLSAESIADVCRQLEPFKKELAHVYLVQKELKVYPKNPMYVMAVNPRVKALQLDSDFNQKLLDKLLQTVRPNAVQGSVFYIVGNNALLRKIKKIPNALILKT